jgi:dTDP-glucose 4,6-dehydratase
MDATHWTVNLPARRASYIEGSVVGKAGAQRGVVVSGGAGFIGSHLCERLLREGKSVWCVDNLSTGSLANIQHLLSEPGFEFVEHDITHALDLRGDYDEIYHFASPASPADFARIPIAILKVGSFGTYNCLEFALKQGARFLLASTSEVYGDPLVHPQPESYHGNVNPIGPRSVYDEAKRFAEAMTMAYSRHHAVTTHIVRIFNTYGPRMRRDDGRMIPNFITQTLQGVPMTVYGDGSQTRSIQFVSDLIEGVRRLMDSSESRPVNIGNPDEYTVRQIVDLVVEVSGRDPGVTFEALPEDDPLQRRPDISRARDVLGWEPRVRARDGLRATYQWFANGVVSEQAV